MVQSQEPFTFFSRLHLVELTGVHASTVSELAQRLRDVSGACIYHHTHHFIQQHQHLSPEPPNDFAYWASEALGDRQLGEELASIDVMSHSSIRSIREALIAVLENALRARPRIRQLTAPEGRAFAFLKSVSFIFPTPHVAHDLREFAGGLRQVSVSSIYFHMFEARLRLDRPTNDFSNWLAGSLGLTRLALKIARLDPYTHTTEELRAAILRLVEAEIAA